MAAKKLKAATTTAATVYCIIKREIDGYLLNDADGSFAAAPADPYLSLTEHATILGLYEVSESRTVWTTGFYELVFYKQSGGSPTPSADTVIKESLIYVKNDEEQTIANTLAETDKILAFIVSYRRILNELVDRISGLEKSVATMTIDIVELQKQAARAGVRGDLLQAQNENQIAQNRSRSESEKGKKATYAR